MVASEVLLKEKVMAVYYLFKKIPCDQCGGGGKEKVGIFDSIGNDHYYDEDGCERCGGAGEMYEPVKLSGEILQEILSKANN